MEEARRNTLEKTLCKASSFSWSTFFSTISTLPLSFSLSPFLFFCLLSHSDPMIRWRFQPSKGLCRAFVNAPSFSTTYFFSCVRILILLVIFYIFFCLTTSALDLHAAVILGCCIYADKSHGFRFTAVLPLDLCFM